MARDEVARNQRGTACAYGFPEQLNTLDSSRGGAAGESATPRESSGSHTQRINHAYSPHAGKKPLGVPPLRGTLTMSFAGHGVTTRHAERAWSICQCFQARAYLLSRRCVVKSKIDSLNNFRHREIRRANKGRLGERLR